MPLHADGGEGTTCEHFLGDHAPFGGRRGILVESEAVAIPVGALDIWDDA